MIIMVINSGSSSLKYQLFNMESKAVLAKGLCERIGIDGKITHSMPRKLVETIPLKTHRDAIEAVIAYLTNKEYGVINDMGDISAVGHRIGHGGDYFSQATLVDQRVKDAIQDCVKLAPLHNPAALMGIDACEAVLSTGTPHVAVCDTAFHQTMPKEAYTYSLPNELIKKHNIRRYGFHGMSHRYVSEQTAELLGLEYAKSNIITCHLGNGSSIAAVKNGKSIDTTMGFTSLEGIIMGTRCGDTDPGMITYLMKEEGMTAADMESILYRQSGALGISGISPDFRDIEDEAAKGDEQAELTLKVLGYQIKKYIGAYMAAMGGVDAIAFTAGIGENSDIIRERSLTGLERLGIILDVEKNKTIRGKAAIITRPDSKIPVVVMPTNEEWVIASDVKTIVEGM